MVVASLIGGPAHIARPFMRDHCPFSLAYGCSSFNHNFHSRNSLRRFSPLLCSPAEAPPAAGPLPRPARRTGGRDILEEGNESVFHTSPFSFSCFYWGFSFLFFLHIYLVFSKFFYSFPHLLFFSACFFSTIFCYSFCFAHCSIFFFLTHFPCFILRFLLLSKFYILFWFSVFLFFCHSFPFNFSVCFFVFIFLFLLHVLFGFLFSSPFPFSF